MRRLDEPGNSRRDVPRPTYRAAAGGMSCPCPALRWSTYPGSTDCPGLSLPARSTS